MKRILIAICVIAIATLFATPPPSLAAASPTGIAAIGGLVVQTPSSTTNYLIDTRQLEGLTAGMMTVNYTVMTADLTVASPEHASGSLDRSTGLVLNNLTSLGSYSTAATQITDMNGASNTDPLTSASTPYRGRYSDIGSQPGPEP